MSAADGPQGAERQFSLALAVPAPAFDRLLRTPANADALEALAAPERWAAPALAMIGPACCGKTTIASAWAKWTGGRLQRGEDLQPAGAPPAAGRPLALDDAHRADRDALLSLFAAHTRSGTPLLLTAPIAPAEWTGGRPDLASRLRALAVVTVAAPDPESFRLHLEAALRRRLIAYPRSLIGYLERRLDLTYDAIESFADRLKMAVREQDAEVTMGLAGALAGAYDEVNGEGESNGERDADP